MSENIKNLNLTLRVNATFLVFMIGLLIMAIVTGLEAIAEAIGQLAATQK